MVLCKAFINEKSEIVLCDNKKKEFAFLPAKNLSVYSFKCQFSPRKVKKGEQGWFIVESTRFPPVWPEIDSRTRRHMWVEFVVGSRPRSEKFFSGYSSFSLSSKSKVSN